MRFHGQPIDWLSPEAIVKLRYPSHMCQSAGACSRDRKYSSWWFESGLEALGWATTNGLNGHRLYYIISLFKVTYRSTIQVSRTFYKDLGEFLHFRLMRASVSSTRKPMKPEFRPSSKQGLASAVKLGRPFITSPPRHPWLSTPLLADLL